MVARKVRPGGNYALRDAPSDIIQGRPSRPPSEAPQTRSSVPEGPDRGRLPAPPPTPDLERSEPVPSAVEGDVPRHSFIRPRAGGEQEEVVAVALLLEELTTCAPGEAYLVLGRLERFPAPLVARMLTRAFPGPVWCSRQQTLRRLPRAHETSGIAAALASLGEVAIPYVGWLLESDSEDIQFYAALVAQEIPDPSLLEPLRQLVLGSDRPGRLAAIAALEAAAHLPDYVTLTAWLTELGGDVKTRQVWRVRALEALAALGEAAALRMMIECLGDRDRTIARAAHEALRQLTCHDLGTMRFAWKRWMRSHERQPRIQWLIEGLADRRVELRVRAAQELHRLTGEQFDLHENAGRKAFLAARDRYAAWWQRHAIS